MTTKVSSKNSKSSSLVAKKKKAATRSHSKETKAVAIALLDTNKGNISQTARDMNLPEKTVNNWANGLNGANDPEVLALIPQAKELLKDDLWTTAYEANKRLRTLLLGATNLKEVALTLAIVIDKAVLISGETKKEILNSFDFQAQADAEREQRRLQAVK